MFHIDDNFLFSSHFFRTGNLNGIIWDENNEEFIIDDDEYLSDIQQIYNKENIKEDLTTAQKMFAYKFLIALDNITNVTEFK
jgi:hypothetical protein